MRTIDQEPGRREPCVQEAGARGLIQRIQRRALSLVKAGLAFWVMLSLRTTVLADDASAYADMVQDTPNYQSMPTAPEEVLAYAPGRGGETLNRVADEGNAITDKGRDGSTDANTADPQNTAIARNTHSLGAVEHVDRVQYAPITQGR